MPVRQTLSKGKRREEVVVKGGVYLCVRSRCSAEGEKEEKKKVVQETLLRCVLYMCASI